MGSQVEAKTRTFVGGTFVLFVAIPLRKNLFQVNKKMMKKAQMFFGTLVTNFDHLLAKRQEKPIHIFP